MDGGRLQAKNTKGTWRMHKQCVPGSFSSFPHESLGARLPSYLPPSVMYTVKGVDGRRLQATYSAKCSAKASSRTHGSGAHGTV